MFMMRMPSSAKPRTMSSSAMRSPAGMGPLDAAEEGTADEDMWWGAGGAEGRVGGAGEGTSDEDMWRGAGRDGGGVPVAGGDDQPAAASETQAFGGAEVR